MSFYFLVSVLLWGLGQLLKRAGIRNMGDGYKRRSQRGMIKALRDIENKMRY
jgi:hypothetical protein